jgi:electron transfer flavoprotein beta subunit
VDETGTALDETFLDLTLNEFDDHAIEEAILLKERYGAHVTVIAMSVEGADDVLATAAAKGADRLLKLKLDAPMLNGSHALAEILAAVIGDLPADLILTGVQAHHDLDGQLGPLLAERLGLPYIGYIAGVALGEGTATVRKEFPGGLLAEMEVTLPAALGIQAADAPPRYVAISRIQQAKKTAPVEVLTPPAVDPTFTPKISRMYKPESGERATLLQGEPDQVAGRVLQILAEHGL